MKTPCAGVVAVAPDKRVAVVFTKYPSLPKGKRKKVETNEQCARRELTEETGLVAGEFIPNLSFIEHHRKEFPVCEYFVWRCDSTPPLQPEDGDEIERAEWVPWDKLLDLDWKPNRRITIQQIVETIKTL